MKTPRRLGVLGGMGPLATADFMTKLVVSTPAETDQQHIPVIVYSVPQIPDRAKAILDPQGRSPIDAMVAGLRTLEAANVDGIAIPCVTAHYWYKELCSATSLPILHITDATDAALRSRGTATAKIALLGTAGTIRGGHVEQKLTEYGYHVVLPTDAQMHAHVLPAITAVKAGEVDAALEYGLQAVDVMLTQNVDQVVLACTELPAALARSPLAVQEKCLDTVAALARYCVAWATAP
jgi:aspartate racemase